VKRLLIIVLVLVAVSFLLWRLSDYYKLPFVTESPRNIPIAYQVDVVVVGGSTGAVTAAATAARAGAKVFLAAPNSYLGEDMAATCRLWREKKEPATDLLAEQVFAPGSPATPLQVKRTLDAALLNAKVDFLFNSYVTDILRDDKGNIAGVVIANRAGRQAVTAKVIIDATDRAWVARMAGASFSSYPAGKQKFTRVVIGGESKPVKDATIRRSPQKYWEGYNEYSITEYDLNLVMKDGSYTSWAAAEQQARDLTDTPSQAMASDHLFQVPPDNMKGAGQSSGAWNSVESLSLDAFRPAGLKRLYIIGGCADISRTQAESLLRPDALMAMGRRIGAAAALEAKDIPALTGVNLTGKTEKQIMPGTVCEELNGMRPGKPKAIIKSAAHSIPVIASYDVVVIGGGTSGCPAGIAAARQGAKTLVVEALNSLGGVGTMGAIASYWNGYRGGFTKEVPGDSTWSITERAQWWRTTLRSAKADIWFGTMGVGSVVENGRVVGVVVATPQGRGVVRAKVVVDSTGSADIAIASGATPIYTDDTEIAVQGTGLPAQGVVPSHENTDFTLTDETDMLDVWRLFVATRKDNANSFDVGQLIDTRERRRMVGDFTLSILDEVNGRKYPDTICLSYSDFDTHGYTIDPYFSMEHPDKHMLSTYTPYRALLPKGLDGIIVTGLGISAHRDAMPLIRMQADLQNQGYGAGLAAAMAVKQGGYTRKIDIKKLQEQLIKKGNLPASVLTDVDTYPMTTAQINEAIDMIKQNYREVSVLLAQPEQSIPLLKQALNNTANKNDKLIYAHILSLLGDNTGVDIMLAAVASSPWDSGWDYRAAGQFGPSMSRLDSIIYALGKTKDRRAVPVIVEKLKKLNAKSEFSHTRVVSLALEEIGDPAAAPELANLLRKPGIGGYIMPADDLNNDLRTEPPRGPSLREITLAHALYRCGDVDGLGESILREYANDIRGHFARHAQAVLVKGKSTPH